MKPRSIVSRRNAMGFRALGNAATMLSGEPPLDPIWS